MQNPNWLIHLVNLTWLDLGNNDFTGSLEFVQNMNNLEVLDISKTNLEYDLNYLPLSLKWISLNSTIDKELLIYGNNLSVYRETHPELFKQNLIHYSVESSLEVVMSVPEYLKEELSKATVVQKADFNLVTPNYYSEFALRHNYPFSWERISKARLQQLPLRLYNIITDQVIEASATLKQINSYAALSYVWGTNWEPEIDRIVTKSDGQTYEVRLTKLGRKAINKAKQTLKFLNQNQANLHYIWIDNYCINQGDNQEKGEEVRKQKAYYDSAIATLIAVDAKVGNKINRENKLFSAQNVIKQIVTSSWFTRSWTFQEGLLSKQTIFMFDDALVDGRLLANIWGALQEKNSWDNSWIQLNTKTFATPLGWSQDNHQGKNVNLGLSQALAAVQHRKQTVALDGIYSVLGLLPYGEQIKPQYKSRGHTYTSEELESVLLEIMKIAMVNGYPEPLLWASERRNKPELWWIPAISNDGTANIEGVGETSNQFEDLKITANGLQFIGRKDKWGWNKQYATITNDHKNAEKHEKKFYILVPTKENNNLPVKVMYFDYPMGSFSENSKTFIDMVNKKVIVGEEAVQEHQAQVEVPQIKKH